MSDDNIISRTSIGPSRQDNRESAHHPADDQSDRTAPLAKPEKTERRRRQAPSLVAAGKSQDQQHAASTPAIRRGLLAATDAERLEQLEQALEETQRKLWEARWEIYDLKLELLLLKKTCDRE